MSNIELVHQQAILSDRRATAFRVFCVALPVIVGALLLAFTLYFLIPENYTTEYHESPETDEQGRLIRSGEYRPWTGSEAWTVWYMSLGFSYMLIFIFQTNFLFTVRYVRCGEVRFRVIGSIPYGSFELLFGPKIMHKFIETPKKTILSNGIGHESYDTVLITLIKESLEQQEFLMFKKFGSGLTEDREVKD